MAGDFVVVGGGTLDVYSNGIQDFFAVNRSAAAVSEGDVDDLKKLDLEERQVEVLRGIMNARVAEFGLENFIANSPLELLSRVEYLKERVKTAEKLIFKDDKHLKAEHLTFIADCCKDRTGNLVLQISNCENVAYEDLKALDGIVKIQLEYTR